jgi:hypothetical protein
LSRQTWVAGASLSGQSPLVLVPAAGPNNSSLLIRSGFRVGTVTAEPATAPTHPPSSVSALWKLTGQLSHCNHRVLPLQSQTTLMLDNNVYADGDCSFTDSELTCSTFHYSTVQCRAVQHGQGTSYSSRRHRRASLDPCRHTSEWLEPTG